MAIVDVKVPQFSESVEEGTLISWKKKPGEAVAQDEILIEVETDKVVQEVPAPAAGVLAEVLVADGARPSRRSSCWPRSTPKARLALPPRPPPHRRLQQLHRLRPPLPPAPAAAAAGGVAMPSAAKLMAENNLSAGQVAGHGPRWPHHQGRRAGCRGRWRQTGCCCRSASRTSG
ncbi:biotin/lipoyl-containing protein, partial [Aminobacter aganoensis]|uniref:biotin/lipoyl-containing protein n=1 Tax=Aminobacter aganoensis TaxID=83264 RepID=UPI0031E76499